jgi:hypothetical protein
LYFVRFRDKSCRCLLCVFVRRFTATFASSVLALTSLSLKQCCDIRGSRAAGLPALATLTTLQADPKFYGAGFSASCRAGCIDCAALRELGLRQDICGRCSRAPGQLIADPQRGLHPARRTGLQPRRTLACSHLAQYSTHLAGLSPFCRS